MLSMEDVKENTGFVEAHTFEEKGFRYAEAGSGPTIVVLHGLFGALSNFRSLFEHFSPHYRVVIPTLPLYTMPALKTNVKALSDFLHDFMQFKGLENVNLVGNSLGGHVALLYTSEHREKVNSMTLTASSGLYENSLGGTFPKRGNYDFIKKKVALTFYDPVHATKDLVDETFRIVNNNQHALRILHLAKSAIRHNMAKELPKMNVPTCLIWGRNDTITPPEVAEEFQNLLPKADLYWLDECGHAPMMEHPDKFNSTLSKWLSRMFIR